MFQCTPSMEIPGLPVPVSPLFVRETLFSFLTENRRLKISAVAKNRCFSCFPVLDGLYDRGNVSAVLRSTEALGFGQAYVVESSQRFKESQRTTAGADKWLEIRRFKTNQEAIASLNQHSIQIISTALSPKAIPIEEVDFTKPTALVFGNEKEGVSEEFLQASHAHVIIPMEGFVQSFNISVAASLALWIIQKQRILKRGYHEDVTPSDIIFLEALYSFRTLDSSLDILRRSLHHAP
jgi:tRNA (guanosine-2'-O-)-methyltransferase